MRAGVIGCLLLAMLLLASCTPRTNPKTPLETLSDSVAAAKAACVEACAGTTSRANITVLQDAKFYTTADAVCGIKQNKLLCGACPCVISENASIEQPGTYECLFNSAGDAGTIQVTCSPRALG